MPMYVLEYLSCHVLIVFVFFFFQAEDGIRDTSVTGVQTCALPICSSWTASPTAVAARPASTASSTRTGPPRCCSATRPTTRSEERRVGKECRYRWWAEH